MTTHNRARDDDAYRELPFLLKPSPVATTAKGRRSFQPGPAADASVDTPPPPSAGFNPYFDLPPDPVIPAPPSTKGEQR